MTDFTLRPLTVPERKYTYAQSSQLQGQTDGAVIIATGVDGEINA